MESIQTPKPSLDFVTLAKNCGLLCFDVEFDFEVADLWQEGYTIDGCGFSTLDEMGNIVTDYIRDLTEVERILTATFPDPKIEHVAHGAKADVVMLKRGGIWPCDPAALRCTMILTNLLDDNLNESELGLKPTVLREYDHTMQKYNEAHAFGMDSEEFYKYACEDVFWELKVFMDKRGPGQEFWRLFTEILMPSTLTFADIEMAGLCWDKAASFQFHRNLCRARDSLHDKIIKKIGRINLNSPEQMSNRLFGELGYKIPAHVTVKAGSNGNLPVNAQVLEALAPKYPVCNWIRAYRSANKLIGTYLEPCQDAASNNFDGRIHSVYWLVSKTGRTRCSKVNNQNFPAHVGADLGDLSYIFEDVKIRQAIACPPGKKMIVCDFSQIELRIAGHVMQEPDLIDAYCDWKCWDCGASGTSPKLEKACPKCGIPEDEKAAKAHCGFWQGRDLHTEVLDYVPAKVRAKLTRTHGKVLNFAILYNASGWRLSHEHPGLSAPQWQDCIDHIMEKRKKVKEYHEKSAQLLKTVGKRKTMFGRRRTIPRDRWMYSNGNIDKGKYKNCLNEFVNCPIQGPGSTMCQIAQTKLRAAWIKKGWWMTRACITNMVHDEIVVECDEDIAEEALADVIYWMENSVGLCLPIRAEGGIYNNWSEAK